jgi:hypothetical protein
MKMHKTRKRLLIIFGILALSVISIIVASFIFFTLSDWRPTDTKIIDILHENEATLLSIEGVVGAGIARDEMNYIVGIAIYVEDSMTDFQRVPNKLDGFQVVIKKMSEASEFERTSMIIRKH